MTLAPLANDQLTLIHWVPCTVNVSALRTLVMDCGTLGFPARSRTPLAPSSPQRAHDNGAPMRYGEPAWKTRSWADGPALHAYCLRSSSKKTSQSSCACGHPNLQSSPSMAAAKVALKKLGDSRYPQSSLVADPAVRAYRRCYSWKMNGLLSFETPSLLPNSPGQARSEPHRRHWMNRLGVATDGLRVSLGRRLSGQDDAGLETHSPQ